MISDYELQMIDRDFDEAMGDDSVLAPLADNVFLHKISFLNNEKQRISLIEITVQRIEQQRLAKLEE